LKPWRTLFARFSYKTSEVGKSLQALPFFADCAQGELHRLELLLYRREYGSGELVCSKSAPGNALYIVQKGRLESSRAPLTAGDFFGAEGLFGDARYDSDILALEESTLLVLFRHDLERFARRYPDAADRITGAFLCFFAEQKRGSQEGGMDADSEGGE